MNSKSAERSRSTEHPSPLRSPTLLIVLAMLLTLSVSLMAQTRPVVNAEQGAIARWAGEGTDTCGMDGKSWSALGETCFFPIDMERSPGRVEIARWRNGGTIETAWLDVVDREFEVQEIDFPDDRYVHLSSEDLEAHQKQQARLRPLLAKEGGEAKFSLPLAKPVSGSLPEARDFGRPRVFNGTPKQAHTGADYSIGLGTEVLAVADGEVLLAEEHFFGGNSVFVYHGDGLISEYLHLSEIAVTKGQEITQGTVVGRVGQTGRATGPHLHLGFRWKEARIAPSLMLQDPTTFPSVLEQ